MGFGGGHETLLLSIKRQAIDPSVLGVFILPVESSWKQSTSHVRCPRIPEGSEPYLWLRTVLICSRAGGGSDGDGVHISGHGNDQRRFGEVPYIKYQHINPC